jgi:hypothetical protein
VNTQIKINLKKASQDISLFGYFLLFPLFFVYHFCISQNYIPPFLGGLFGNISLSIAIISTLFLPWMFKKQINYVKPSVYLFYFAISFYLIWTFGCHYLVQIHPFGIHSFIESYSSFIIWASLFYIGYFLPYTNNLLLITLKILCFVIFFIFIFVIIKEKSFFALFMIFQNNEESSTLSSYQQAGRAIFVSFLFLALLINSRLYNILLLIICAVILLAIGSRTDLISVSIAIFLYGFHIFLKGNKSMLKKSLIFLTFFILISITIILTKSFFYDSRAAEIFNLATSTSWQGRSDLSNNAITVIKQNLIFGKFDYYESSGGYAHNILSSWTSFGFFGFLLYSYLLLHFLAISVFGYFVNSEFSLIWLLVLILNFISFSQALFAAPIFSALPALGWGLTLNVYLKSKFKK